MTERSRKRTRPARSPIRVRTRARKKEQKKLARQRLKRQLDRGLTPSGLPRWRAGLIFALSLAAGIALALPLEKELGRWALDGLGKLETISIQGNSQLSFDEVALATGVERGRSLGELNPIRIQDRLRLQPWIREANVLALPPSTLLVRVEERRPRALLLDREGAVGGRLVDASGHLFAPALGNEKLPRLVGGESLALNHVHESLVTALALLETLENLALNSTRNSEGLLELWLPREGHSEGWVIRGAMEIVLGRDHLMARINKLAGILQSEQVDRAIGDEHWLIDLRFADQAVLRALTKKEKKKAAISRPG